MGKIKDQFLSFFNFSKKETKGILVLIIVLGIVLFIPSIKNHFTNQESFPSKEDQHYLDSITEILLKQSLKDSSNKINPNKLSYFQWMDLGISSDLANTILRKKRKQKQFNCLSEIKAIKGVSSSNLVNYYDDFSLIKYCPKIKKKIKYYNINTVSKKEISSISGISPKTAQRIINYRKSLGGFHSKTQLKEVPKLTKKEFNYLKSHLTKKSSPIKKININTVNRYSLKKHPYLTTKQASTIINYRKKISRYENISEFKKVYGLTANDVEKIQPYLSFE